jgi:hypothetical protein
VAGIAELIGGFGTLDFATTCPYGVRVVVGVGVVIFVDTI